MAIEALDGFRLDRQLLTIGRVIYAVTFLTLRASCGPMYCDYTVSFHAYLFQACQASLCDRQNHFDLEHLVTMKQL